MKYKAEFIHKKSTFSDIIDNWRGLGKNGSDSPFGFTFEDLEKPPMIQGHVITVYDKGNIYHYNMTDFYRVKVSEV